MPPLEAPYKGQPAPAKAENAAPETDKPRTDAPTIPNLAADKRHAPPVEDEDTATPEEDTTGEDIERLTDETTDAPDGDVDPNLILMRADYTKKTMALKERERELADRYGTYEQVDRLLADNPGLARTHTVEQLVALVQNGQAPEATRTTILPPEVRAELTAMRKEVAETKQTLFADRAESAVRRVAAQYRFTPKETKELVETAVAEGLLTEDTPPEKIGARLNLVAKAITADRAKAKGQQELVTKLKEKQKAASAGTASSAPPASETPSARHKGWAGLIAKHQREYRSG